MRQTDLFEKGTKRSKEDILALLNSLIDSNARKQHFLINRGSDFAEEWGIPIHRSFFNSLDISESAIVTGTLLDGTMLPPRTRLSKKDRERAKTILRKAITQGSNFSFSAKDVIYDSPDAYVQNWADCLKGFLYRIEILSAASAGGGYAGSVKYIVHKNTTRLPGPMMEIGNFQCTQHEFVRRLIVGISAILES